MSETANNLIPGRNVTVKQAAVIMGKSQQFIRICLQKGKLPIGSAIQGPTGQWNYYISPKLFSDYVGWPYAENQTESY